MIYEVSMGTRRENGTLQERLDAFLREEGPTIHEILRVYVYGSCHCRPELCGLRRGSIRKILSGRKNKSRLVGFTRSQEAGAENTPASLRSW